MVHNTIPLQINSDNLVDFVGKPVFPSERLYHLTPPGVVMGLAWTSMGGSTLYIESVPVRSLKEGAGGLQLTGKLGDVMKESGQIALSVARRFIRDTGMCNLIIANTRRSFRQIIRAPNLHIWISRA